jgi:hypothetical protein
MSVSPEFIGWMLEYIRGRAMNVNGEVIGHVTDEEREELTSVSHLRAALDASLDVAIKLHTQEMKVLILKNEAVFNRIIDRLELSEDVVSKGFSADHRTGEIRTRK